MMDRKSDIAEIAEVLGGITEAARELAINEQDDWFDAQTVKRNMSELTKLGGQFDRVAIEAKNLDQRLHGLYEDMGHILSRYYKIGEVSEEMMKERLGLKEDGKLQGGEKDPCWKGYEMIGMKPGKGGSQVPNCVPKNESVNEAFPTKKVDAKVIADRMRNHKETKGFADKIEKLKMVSAEDLDKMLPDYVDGGVITKIFKESVNEATLSKDSVVRTLTSDKNAYFLTKQ
jgi:hypothetical protein